MAHAKPGARPAERVGKRSRTVSFLLLLLFSPVLASAEEISLSSRTYLLAYERDVAGGPSRRFVPVYEYLSADVRGLGGTPVSFHFYGWGRQDLQDASGGTGGKTAGELGSAYLAYIHPTGNAEGRLGRFFLSEGGASEIMDGVFLKGRTGSGAGASLYAGVPVERSITSTGAGHSIFGGRVFYVRPGVAEIGAGYLFEQGEFQGKDRREISGDIWLRPPGPVEAVGRAAYNDATGELSFQRYVIRLMPLPAVDVALGYETYTYKDSFQTALNPAFLSPAIDDGDKVRIVSVVLDWEAAKNLTLEAGVKNFRHSSSDPGDASRVEAGVRYAYNDRKDAGGVSAALVTADLDENAYTELRGFASHTAGKWRFALDALAHRYKQAIAGTSNAYQVVGSAGYRVLDILNLSGDLTYQKSPRFSRDLALLVRASLLFETATGGKK